LCHIQLTSVRWSEVKFYILGQLKSFYDYEEVARSGLSVRVVGASNYPWFRWERVSDVNEKLLIGFIETDDWVVLIIRFVVEGEYISHTADEFLILSG